MIKIIQRHKLTIDFCDTAELNTGINWKSISISNNEEIFEKTLYLNK